MGKVKDEDDGARLLNNNTTFVGVLSEIPGSIFQLKRRLKNHYGHRGKDVQNRFKSEGFSTD